MPPPDHAAALCAITSALLTAIARGDYDHISAEACPAVADARDAQRAYWHDAARASIVVAEGYATAAAMQQATGLPAVVVQAVP